MFAALGTPALLAIFAVSAAVIWIAGVKLSNATDVLSRRLGLGEALGGVILLAIATNLPEIAITASAAWSGNVDVAVGNILGGIAIQTVVLVALDRFGTRDGPPLTYRAASLTLVVEGLLVVAVLAAAIMAAQLPADLVAARMTPGAGLIAVLWVSGSGSSAAPIVGCPGTKHRATRLTRRLSRRGMPGMRRRKPRPAPPARSSSSRWRRLPPWWRAPRSSARATGWRTPWA